MNRAMRRERERANRSRVASARRAEASGERRVGVDFGAPAGARNAYLCRVCERYTVVVHVDAGVTPMFLGCRASGIAPGEPGSCPGTASSTNYQPEPWPEADRGGRPIPEATWEWYAADEAERLGLESLSLRRIEVSS